MYVESGQKQKALEVASQLLRKEVKVESEAIEEMREELKRLFEE
jgi:hypothetical protein